MDVGVQTNTVLILGEAKWRSGVGKAQGVAGDKDQIQLRADYCRKYGPRVYPAIERFIILGIGQSSGLLSSDQLAHSGGTVSVREVTWDSLGSLEANPNAAEFRSHIAWRKAHSLGCSSE